MKILILSYSQTGQLDEILRNIALPLNNFELDIVNVKPKTPYPFPWTSFTFFNVMPETVLEEKIELEEINYKYDNYDLIIIGYQPWFLSPSLPVSSLLQTERFKKIVNNKPIITVIGARNMWINSQRSVVKHIDNSGGKIVANIPFIDKNNNLISAVTIVYWMFTGKKNRLLNIFPKPGICQKDIDYAEFLGGLIKKHLSDNKLQELTDAIIKTSHINISSNILFIEKRAKKIFVLWAKLIKRADNNKLLRVVLIRVFQFYLFFALFIVASVVLIVYNLFFYPFVAKSVNNNKTLIYNNKF